MGGRKLPSQAKSVRVRIYWRGQRGGNIALGNQWEGVPGSAHNILCASRENEKANQARHIRLYVLSLD